MEQLRTLLILVTYDIVKSCSFKIVNALFRTVRWQVAWRMSCSPTVPAVKRQRRQHKFLQFFGRFDPVYRTWKPDRHAENTDLFRRNYYSDLKPDTYCQFLKEYVKKPAFAQILANNEPIDLRAWAKADKKKRKKSFAKILKYEKRVRNVNVIQQIEFIEGKNLNAWHTAISYGQREMLSPQATAQLYVDYLDQWEIRKAQPDGQLWINGSFVPALHEFYEWTELWGEPAQNPYVYLYDRKSEKWLNSRAA